MDGNSFGLFRFISVYFGSMFKDFNQMLAYFLHFIFICNALIQFEHKPEFLNPALGRLY